MRDLEDDLYSRRTGGAGSLGQPLADEDYEREMEKLGQVAAAAGNRERDEYAMSRIHLGMGAEARGVRGFVAEKHPGRGTVAIENWDRSITVPAREVVDTETGERMTPPREDISDLERRYL